MIVVFFSFFFPLWQKLKETSGVGFKTVAMLGELFFFFFNPLTNYAEATGDI